MGRLPQQIPAALHWQLCSGADHIIGTVLLSILNGH